MKLEKSFLTISFETTYCVPAEHTKSNGAWRHYSLFEAHESYDLEKGPEELTEVNRRRHVVSY